ncbi:DNA primase family protein [Neoaquamicrobium microcysteis]|nr:phage/plasmid primase, P4 family [Mesorhizobium microcysteis]
MRDLPTDLETETETEPHNRFTHLFAITPKRRERLFRPDNLTLLAELKVTHRAMYERLMRHLTDNGVSKLRELEAAVDRRVRAIEKAARNRGEPDSGNVSPLAMARRFRDEVHPTLLWYESDWLLYRGTHYDLVEPDLVKRDVYAFIEDAGGSPDAKTVSNVLDALKGVALVERGTFAPPCWLDAEEGDLPAGKILACGNGLLHLPTGALLPSSSRFFTRNGLPYDYDPAAPEPAHWLKFLADLWGHDPEQIRLLQELFGYLLIPDTSLQKFFVLLGPPRSGKGTILRVLDRLLGSTSICSPTLEHLGTRFGLQGTLGKTLAVIADMRLPTGRNADRQNIVGNILRIVGEDPVDVERKHVGGALTVRLAIRILIATNLPPALPDVSGALTGRLVALKMTESFLGREDLTLDRRLQAELPGILNWAIGGWRRLHEQGHFTVTAASRDVADNMADLASPLNAFLRDCCELDPEVSTPKGDVWAAYQSWTLQQDLPLGYSSPNFFHRDLEVAARHKIKTVRPRGDDGRSYHWAGIRMLQPAPHPERS